MDVSLKRIAILATVFALLPAAASADNSGWYIAADAGQSHYTGLGDVSGIITTFNANGTGYRLTAGYQFNLNWGLEASYVDLGQASGNGTGNVYGVPPLGCDIVCVFDQYNVKLMTHGWAFAVTGTYPFLNRWSVFVRVGIIDARSELDINNTPIPPNTSATSTNLKSTYGLGVNWSFVDHWALRLGWDRYANLGDSSGTSPYFLVVNPGNSTFQYCCSSTGTYNVNLVSLGIVYSF